MIIQLNDNDDDNYSFINNVNGSSGNRIVVVN